MIPGIAMVTSDERHAFSSRLNEALDAADVPPKHQGRQKAVADLFGVSQNGARKWMDGESIPDTKRLPQIADKLNVSVEWLLIGRSPNPPTIRHPQEIEIRVNLGDKCRDTVTGFEGIATVRCEYISGRTRIGLQPSVDKDGKIPDAQHFDEPMLVVVQARKLEFRRD